MLQRKTLKKKKKIVRKKREETWLDVKREIRPKFFEAGILDCELYNVVEFTQAVEEQLGKKQDCKIYLFLTFAHSLRRTVIKKYKGEERARLLREVIKACSSCHQLLDSLDHDTTTKIVRNIINKRRTPIV